MDLRILGPLELVGDDGRELPLRGPRARAVLARLALAPNQVVSSDRLIDAVWGESAPSGAQGGLQVQVHGLRKALGADRIVTRAPGYLLRLDEGELDATRFERLVAEAEQLLRGADRVGAAAVLEEALALWRGPALADVEHEPFAQIEANRLEELRLVALEGRFEAELGLGRHAALVPELEALVAAHPLRERLRAQLMLALYRSNRQADALETYRQARAAMVDGLGIEPGAELRELEQAILRQDPELDAEPQTPAGPRLSPSTPLIGRDLERASVAAYLRLPDTRLLTLTGLGGVGKTRLALAAADDLGRAVLVDLAPLSEAEHVLPAVAAALGADEASVDAVAAHLATAYRDPPLLILDNCEHLSAAYQVVADLLAASPALRVLATSRVPLRLASEHEYRVPPLEVPARGAETAAAVGSAHAVRLYVERVRSVIPTFELGDGNAGAVARICRALDGLPLAIELAAARVRVLGPEGTAKRLGERLLLLARSAPDLPPRQRSLRATLDWSYELLDEEARGVFRTLGVFADGVSLDGVEAVHGADATTGLEELLDAGLAVHVPDVSGEPRFAMLETIREYALSRLNEGGCEDVTRERHLDYYLSLAETYAEREHEAGPTPALLDAAEADLADIRAALAWAEVCQDPERQLRLVFAIRFWFFTRGERGEGRRMVAAALQRSGSAAPALRARILVEAGGAAIDEGDEERGIALLRSALPDLEEAGDRATTGRVYAHIGGALARVDRLDEAIDEFERSAELFRELGDERRLSHALTQLAEVLIRKGEHEAARASLLDALEMLEPIGSSASLAYALYMIGCASAHAGDRSEAARYAVRALEETRRVGHHELLAYELLFVSDLVLEDSPDGAAELLGASSEELMRAGVPIQASEGARVAELEASLAELIGRAGATERAADGRRLTSADAVARASELLQPLLAAAPRAA